MRSSATIKNGKDIPLNTQMGTIPNMSDTLRNWFQSMEFVRVRKRTVNFQLEECNEVIRFQGTIQPLKNRDLMMKPEGQRAWTWLEVHADASLILNVDDEIVYQCVQNRVMARSNYDIYGYVYYQLVQDWNKQ